MRFLGSERRRWWLLAGGWVLLLVLGIGGFVQQAADLDLSNAGLDNLYNTLQLAALEYEGASEAVNWRLQVARFVAPLMAAGTLLQSASVVFRDQFTHWRARRARGHTVVCGLGPAGAHLVAALVRDGRSVVGVEADPAAPGVAAARELGVPVLVADPTDATTLETARVDRAARVVAIGPDDAGNVAVVAAVGGVARHRGLAPLRCAVHLTDGELAHLLRATELGGAGSDLRIEFFNLHERAAHALLAAHPFTGTAQDRAPHLVVLGLGQFGLSVVVAAAQQWAEVGDGPLTVTLVDRRAAGRFHALRMQHPALAAAIDPTCVELDIGAPSERAVDELEGVLAERPPSLVVVAFEQETLAWSSGLFVRQRVRLEPVDIVVRTESDGGLGALLAQTVAGGLVGSTGRLVTFPFLASACSVELIEGGVREQLARSIHEDHVLRSGSGAALHRDWAELPDADRESSRAAADALVGRLASIGLEPVPLRQWGAGGMELTADQLDRLAADEHERWRAERSAAGWTWGEVRDDTLRRNPLLLPWVELPESAKDQNRAAAAALPALLARAGFELDRARA